MSVAAILKQERRALFADRMQALLLLSFFALCMYAVLQGAAYRATAAEAVAEFQQEGEASASAWRDRIVAYEKGETTLEDDRWVGLAMGVYLPASAAPGPLADFSLGVSDMQPNTATVSQWRSLESVFGMYQFQSPLAIASGPFDLAFVVVFVMPLLMILLAYDALAEDRERGRLGMLLSQPVSVRDVVFSRLRVRLGAVLALLIVASVIGLIVGGGLGPEGRVLRFGLWLIVAISYFSFWAAVIAWVISLNRKSETTVLALAALWAVNGLVGPAVIAASAEAAYPAPSRLAFLSEARTASSKAYKSTADLMQGMLLDHPDLTVENYSIPEYIRTAFLVTNTVDKSVAPILDEFDAVHSARRAFLNKLQYASPAVLTLQAFNLTAGTDLARQKRFEREVRAYKLDLAKRVEPKVLADERLAAEEFDSFPRFSFEEASAGAVLKATFGPSVFLLIFGLLIWGLARVNLLKLQTRIREE